MENVQYSKRHKLSLSCIIIILVYISITYVWNLVSIDMIDFVFILIMMYSLLFMLSNPVRITRNILGEIRVLVIFSFFSMYQLAYALLNINQPVFETLLTVRELLYFLSAFLFAFYGKFSSIYIKLMIKLELIGCVIYFITFLYGKPISPFANFSASVVIIGTVQIYRDFSPIPLLTMFVCPYLFMGLLNKTYLWNKRKDFYALIIMIFTLGLHLFRTRLILLFFSIVFTILVTEEKEKRKKHIKRIGQVFGILLVIFLIVVAIPVVRERFVEGLTDISYFLSGAELDAHHGTFTYRMWLLSTRIKYLIKNNQFLFGMGAISSRNSTALFGDGVIGLLYNPDNAYLTLLPRYGIIGTTFYIIVLIYFAVKGIKNKTKLSTATGIYIICAVLEGVSGNSALCEYALLLIGMLVGFNMSEQMQINRNREKIDKVESIKKRICTSRGRKPKYGKAEIN